MGRLSKTGAARIAERRQAFRAPDIMDVTQTEPAAPSVVAQPRAVAITIERLILHHLDNRTGEMLLVEAELALDATIHTLFANYIAQALENADWQARFLAEQPVSPAMPDLCARLLGEPSAFVAVSQEMAR